MNTITYFISDLHLSPERGDITECFERFMREQALHADALYVLGDLFEAWIGDDDISSFTHHIADIFKTVSHKVPTYFIHGNRDFLVGQSFCQSAGITLLPEQAVIDLYGTPTLILHGDELCSLDVNYQRFRRIVRHPLTRSLLTALPLAYRKKLARKARAKSVASQQGRNMDSMDVVHSDVVNALNHHGVRHMVHGHTHKPNIHSFKLAEGVGQRIVLGDWYDQGSILEVSADGLQLKTLKHCSV